jgi:hypothetical protein
MLVGNSDSKIEAVVALLERDQALVARVLQLGRSAASFSRSTKSMICEHHQSRGLSPDRQRGGDGLDQRLLSDPRRALSAVAARLSRHSLARALAMRAMAEQQRMDAFSAYSWACSPTLARPSCSGPSSTSRAASRPT